MAHRGGSMGNNTCRKECSGIVVYVEHQNGCLPAHAREVIGIAKELQASLDPAIVSAIVLGTDVENIAKELITFGIDQVLVAGKKDVSSVQEDAQACLISEMITEVNPEIVLGLSTNAVRSLFPRVAAKLLTGLTADCTKLAIDRTTKLLKQTKPVFGGQKMTTIITKDRRPQMATIQPNVFPAAPQQEEYKGTITDMSHIAIPPSAFRLLEHRRDEKAGKTLEQSDIVITIGRGVKGPEQLPLINTLAKKLDGAVGATRAVVDAGWVPYQYQIGQTGKTVNPKLYVALGISGAVQHVIGMNRSDVIVAVNTDPDANIFEIADYGIIGNVDEVIPEMIRQLSAFTR